MKSTLAAASGLLALAAAQPPAGWHGHGGPPGGGPMGGPMGGPFAAFPSCVSSCWSDISSQCSSYTDYSCLCGASTISKANACIQKAGCSNSDKEDTYKAVDQLCANAGVTVTASPEATWSATSGESANVTGARTGERG